MFWATAAWACGVLAVPAVLCPPGPRTRARRRGRHRGPAAVGRVHDDLVRGQVRSGVVQDVPVALRGQDADQGGDEDAQADGRQRRARPGPVAGQVAQGQAYGDRGAPPETSQDHQAEGRQQDDRDDEQDDAADEFQCPAAVAVALAGV